MRRRTWVLWTALLLVALPICAEERGVLPAAPGPNRLDPDPALLARAAPLRYSGESTYAGGLEDLRLFSETPGGERRELPYLLITPRPGDARWVSGSILPVARTKKASGLEADLGAVTAVDRLRVEGISSPFLKRARLEGSGDRAHWTMLASDATLFDLPEQKLRNVEIVFTPGAYRYLRITWDDRASAVVGGVDRVSVRVHDPVAPAEATHVAVESRRLGSEPGKSRYRLRLPGAHLPVVAIEVEVSGGDVFRDASISEPRFSGGELVPQSLGIGKLRRTERFGGAASDMAIPIRFPASGDLDLIIDDGNNPPLSITAVRGKLAPLPWIFFDASPGAIITARYGDSRLNAPRYDLEASRQAIARTNPPRAQWAGGATPTASESSLDTSLAAFRGATVDRDQFRYERALPPARRGVTRLLLDADVLARSRGLDDVRIVDASTRQVPYVVESSDAPLAVELAVKRSDGAAQTSSYALHLPYDHFPPGTRLVIRTDARVFDRNVTLQRPPDDGRTRGQEIVASAGWRGSDPELAAPPLTFDVPSNETRELEVRVDEGDNAPIPVSSVSLLIPSSSLRFYHPGTPLRLLYGNDRVAAPHYDLSLLAPRVLAEPARDLGLSAALVPEEGERNGTERKIFWVVIAAVTVMLLVVLARLIGARPTADA
jgi:hypothetical protein